MPGRGGLARWLERQSGLGHVTARQVAAVIGDGGIEALDGDQDALARCLAVVPSRFPEPCAPPRAGPGTTWRGCLPGSWATGSGRHGCTGLADLDGSWFVLADGVVSALGVAPLLGGRLRAPVVHAIHEAAAEEGHVHLPGGGGDQVQRAERALRDTAARTGCGRGVEGALPATVAARAHAVAARPEVLSPTQPWQAFWANRPPMERPAIRDLGPLRKVA